MCTLSAKSNVKAMIRFLEPEALNADIEANIPHIHFK